MILLTIRLSDVGDAGSIEIFYQFNSLIFWFPGAARVNKVFHKPFGVRCYLSSKMIFTKSIPGHLIRERFDLVLVKVSQRMNVLMEQNMKGIRLV